MTTQNTISKQRRQYWQDHIKEWETSKVTQANYCRKKNIDQDLFSKWKNRLMKHTQPHPFVQVHLDTLPTTHLDIIIHDKITIRVDHTFDPELLRNVLRALGITL